MTLEVLGKRGRLMRILVVEDDLELAAQLCPPGGAGFAVDQEHDGEAASVAGTVEVYSAAVLDLGLPRKDGLSVLRDWRRRLHLARAGADGPQPLERQGGRLQAGADDYLTKPFLMDEVVLRLRAMLRRTAGAARPCCAWGSWNTTWCTAASTCKARACSSPRRSTRSWPFSCTNPASCSPAREISENVYAPATLDPDFNTLDVLIGRIRRKLGGAAQLVTERGQGFRLIASDEAAG